MAGVPEDVISPADRARRAEVMAVLPGLLLAMLLAMLDHMIVGTALPRIVGELGGLAHFSWVVTAYILATTVSTPLWGKVGDLYGRKNIFLASILIFLAGSALSGAAQSMGQLIAFRAVQGLGAGGLMVGVMAIIGDLVSPRERGRYQGLVGGVMAVGMVAGPLVGGFITDNLSWRWAFYVNLPLGGAVLVWLYLRLNLPKRRTEARIDWWGAGLLSVAITSLVLITTWGGTQYAWRSWPILALGAVAVAGLAAFGYVERRAAEPVLSLDLFRDRNFALVSGMGFLVGFGLMGSVNFLPIFQQTVQGLSATNSGLLLLPVMVTMMVVSIAVGRLITRTGRYKVFLVLGGVGMAAGMAVLSRVDVATSTVELGLMMAVLGLGMGCLMQTTLLVAQNSVAQKDIGVASSSAAFFRSIGGSFGVALFGTIFVRRLYDDVAVSLGRDAADQIISGGGQMDPRTIAALPGALREPIYHGIASGLSGIFVWAIPLAAVLFGLAMLIREVPLRTDTEATVEAEIAEGTALAVAE